MSTEIVECRCCGKIERRNYPGPRKRICECSEYFCDATSKCVTHCPLLPGKDEHWCSCSDYFIQTFVYGYEREAVK